MKTKTYVTLMFLSLIAGSAIAYSQTNQVCGLDPVSHKMPQSGYKLMADHDSVLVLSSYILANKDFIITQNPQRPFYNHSFRFSAGYSLNTVRMDNSMRTYNDTSEHTFNIVRHTPTFSFGYSAALDSTFTLGFTMAYSNSEIYYDNKPYGSQFFYLSFNPQLHIFRTYNFEYYIKLKIGVSYEDNNLDMVHSERIQNLYPTGFHMFTGVTVAGVNYLINDHLALNSELSIWSPETINMGLSYRFFKKKCQAPVDDMIFVE